MSGDGGLMDCSGWSYSLGDSGSMLQWQPLSIAIAIASCMLFALTPKCRHDVTSSAVSAALKPSIDTDIDACYAFAACTYLLYDTSIINDTTMVKGSDIILILVAVIFPPAAAAIITGCSCDLLINIVSCIFLPMT